MLTPRKNAILYYNPGTDFDEESGGDLLVRPAKREREKKIARTERWKWRGWRGLVWKISTSYKSAVARTENRGVRL